uniref:Secreted protein n=1 Tax=Zea mays TaxID=4577 RepID=A0A804RK02_MAIZE
MLLAYVLVFLLRLSASTCHATSRNQHLLFAGRAGDSTAPVHHRHTTKVLSDYNDVHYHPAMMPSPASVELAGGIGGSPPPSLSAVEPSGVEGAPPPPPGKRDTSAPAMEPSPSPHSEGGASSSGDDDASATEQEDSAGYDLDDANVDYVGPKTHPPSHN